MKKDALNPKRLVVALCDSEPQVCDARGRMSARRCPATNAGNALRQHWSLGTTPNPRAAGRQFERPDLSFMAERLPMASCRAFRMDLARPGS
jgi:hypothetical protein